MSGDVCTMLQCLACGRWWLTAIGGNMGGPGMTLCPGCHVDCAQCGKPLTFHQLRYRREKRTATRPVCSRSCGTTLAASR